MMKRLLITLSIFILLGIIIPGLPILAQPARTPHENPDRATGSFDSAGLLLSYSRIANLAANSQYGSAREILKELEKVDVPDDIRYIINQYNALSDNLYTTLDSIESLLNETTDMLSHNRVDEAKQSLDSSEAAIQDADNLLRDIEAATRSLSEKLGVFAASASARLSQVYARLEESTARLAGLIARFKNIRADLNERYNRMTGLTPTTLSLYINQASAFVGDNITATGLLERADGPLAGKTISINTDDMSVGTAVTGLDGTYIAKLTVPFLYRDNIIFTAQYEPSHEDSGVFLASRSPSVNMSARFYPTRLDIAVPEMVYRGLPFTLSGEVSTDENNISRQIKVSLDDLALAEATVSGRFSFEVTTPPDAMPGRRNLKIAVAPAGRYAGAFKKPGINLSLMSLRIETQTPAVVLLPASLRISGTVSSGPGPLANAPVVLKLMNSATTVRTASDGSFSGSIKLNALPADAPLSTNPFYVIAKSPDSAYDLSPVNAHGIEITAEIPGYTTVTRTIKRQVLTINPLSAVPGLVLITWLGLVFNRKKRTQTAPEMATITPEAVKLPVEVPATARLTVPVSKFTGIKGRILSAYRSGLTAVEKITGMIMAPSATLREFLKTARLPSPATAAPFAELTAIAESSLYSAGDPPDVIAARAEELVDIIKEELHRGHP
jgi:hypothetical protein